MTGALHIFRAVFPQVLVFLIVGLGLMPTMPATAHEVRPAYLQLTEVAPGIFEVLFKTPMRGDMRLALQAVLPESLTMTRPMASRLTGDALVQSWQVRADGPLQGQEIGIGGLSTTLTDALVRVEFAEGGAWVARLTPASPRAVVPARQDASDVAKTYLRLGVEHILLGIDHLLFILGLMLIAVRPGRLALAVTAFTLAHSVTLAGASLGFVHLPARPVEVAIALSIVFVAVEAVHARRGRVGLGVRLPWMVAFGFGLLHGFGFAGALTEIGIPSEHIPMALCFFNVGVELGQIVFIAAILGFLALARTMRLPLRWATSAPAYVIGVAGMFWVFQRLVAI